MGDRLEKLGVGGGKPKPNRPSYTVRAHRLAYAVWVKPIPKGSVIHHVCNNRSCINPDHLQAISPKENTAELCFCRFLIESAKELFRKGLTAVAWVICIDRSIDEHSHPL